MIGANLKVEESVQIEKLKRQMLDAVSEMEVRYFENEIHRILDRIEQRLASESGDKMSYA